MNVDIDQLFREVDQNQPVRVSGSSSDVFLMDDEITLIAYYRELNEEGQTKLCEYAEDLVASKRYIKNSPDRMVDTKSSEVNK